MPAGGVSASARPGLGSRWIFLDSAGHPAAALVVGDPVPALGRDPLQEAERVGETGGIEVPVGQLGEAVDGVEARIVDELELPRRSVYQCQLERVTGPAIDID